MKCYENLLRGNNLLCKKENGLLESFLINEENFQKCVEGNREVILKLPEHIIPLTPRMIETLAFSLKKETETEDINLKLDLINYAKILRKAAGFPCVDVLEIKNWKILKETFLNGDILLYHLKEKRITSLNEIIKFEKIKLGFSLKKEMETLLDIYGKNIKETFTDIVDSAISLIKISLITLGIGAVSGLVGALKVSNVFMMIFLLTFTFATAFLLKSLNCVIDPIYGKYGIFFTCANAPRFQSKLKKYFVKHILCYR